MNPFEKILDRLRNLKEHYGRLQFGFNDSCEIQKYVGMEQAIDLAIEIVQKVAKEYNGGWIPIKTRPMTEEEREYYSEFLDEDNGMIYECPLPDDEQEVLITSNYGSVDKTTFYTDCGNYFENYEDYDEVIAWQPLPEPFKECD